MNTYAWVTIVFTWLLSLQYIFGGAINNGFAHICHENETSTCACGVNTIYQTPWPAWNDTTAPPPTIYELEYFINAHRKIILNITWWQISSQLEHVTGYFIEINPYDSDVRFKKLVSLQNFTRCNKNPIGKAYFNYAEFGNNTEKWKNPEEVLPGRTYGVLLQATPLYHEGGDSRDDYEAIQIEGCSCNSSDPVNVFNVNYCIANRERLCYTEFSTVITDIESEFPFRLALVYQIIILAFSLICFFLFITFAIFLFVPKLRHKCCRNLYKVVDTGQNMQWSYVLILGELYGCELYRDLVLQIACLLHKHKSEGCRIDCNLWNISQDPANWLQESLIACDHIVLISPLKSQHSSKNAHHDPFRMTLDWLQNGYTLLPKKVSKLHLSLVHLKDDGCSSFLVPKLNNRFINVKNFTFMSRFDDFIINIIGLSPTQLSSEEIKVIQTSYDCCTRKEKSNLSFSYSANDKSHMVFEKEEAVV